MFTYISVHSRCCLVLYPKMLNYVKQGDSSRGLNGPYISGNSFYYTENTYTLF